MSINVMSFAAYAQRLRVPMSQPCQVDSYAVYCEALRSTGLKLQFSDEQPVDLATGVTWSVHERASEPGYCYLYMIRDHKVSYAKRILGANPTMSDLFSLKIGFFYITAIRELRLSLGSNGVYHVGSDGTWSLAGALVEYADSYSAWHRMPPGLRAISPENAGLSPTSVIGYSSTESLPSFHSEESFLHDKSVVEVNIGDRCRIVTEDGELIVHGVVSGPQDILSVSALLSDVVSPKFVRTVSGMHDILTLSEGTCRVCGQFGDVYQHTARCLVRQGHSVERKNDLERARDIFWYDVGTVTRGLPNERMGYDVAESLLADFYTWWRMCGYGYLRQQCSTLHSGFFMYYGEFRQVFLRVLSSFMSTENVPLSLLVNCLPIEYRKWIGVACVPQFCPQLRITQVAIVGSDARVVCVGGDVTECVGDFDPSAFFNWKYWRSRAADEVLYTRLVLQF